MLSLIHLEGLKEPQIRIPKSGQYLQHIGDVALGPVVSLNQGWVNFFARGKGWVVLKLTQCEIEGYCYCFFCICHE